MDYPLPGRIVNPIIVFCPSFANNYIFKPFFVFESLYGGLGFNTINKELDNNTPLMVIVMLITSCIFWSLVTLYAWPLRVT
jgi:hypothetical protein